MSISDPIIITVRDWRRKPPLRLRVTKKLDIHWWDQMHALPAHARGRDCALHHSLGTANMLRRAGRCTNCGKRGVELQHPSWDCSDTGWAPMPISQMAPVPLLCSTPRA
jgi:hypothetical protein